MEQRGQGSGWQVHHVVETGSTNADLLATAADWPDRTVLYAGHQTAGRGRLDRRWDAPPGSNLLASLLFHVVPADPGELSRRVSLAALDGCRRFTTERLSLKWPNDLLLGEAKVAGVLAERNAEGSVVVGIGINIGWCPRGGARLGEGIEPGDVLEAMLAAFDELPADPEVLHQRCRVELSTLGKRVRVHLPDGDLIGTATDLATDGRLVVTDDAGAEHRLDVGDVVHLRPAVSDDDT